MYRDYLLPLKGSGTIKTIERQRKYILQEGFEYHGEKVRPIEYVADFYVQYADGREAVFDFKGMPDIAAKLKRKMFWAKYPELNFQWIAYSKIDGGYVPYEKVQQGRKERAKARKKNKENK